MDLDQHIHADGECGSLELGGGRVVDGRHDDQNTVGTPRSRLNHLVGIKQEVLAQCRQGGRGPSRHEVTWLALERRSVGEYRQACSAALLIGTREGWRIEVGANE